MNYTEKLKEYIGEPLDDRKDYFNLTEDESIEHIKKNLKTAFSCNLWTYKWTNAEIGHADERLTKEGIIHVWDEVLDSFVCFNSEKDMKQFYTSLRKTIPEEDLENIKRHNYNTPILHLFE